MKKNNQFNKYHYQPELASTIIYWSVSLCLFFTGIIIILEKISFSWTAILFIIVGLLLIVKGIKRHVQLNQGEIHFILSPQNKVKKFSIGAIQKISIGSNGCTIIIKNATGQKEEFVCLMREKTLSHFINELSTSKQFIGEIVGLRFNK